MVSLVLMLNNFGRDVPISIIQYIISIDTQQ